MIRDISANSRSSSLLLFLSVLGFVVFFQPQEYALSTGLFRFSQAVICLVSATALLAFFTKCKMTIRWASFCLFYIAFYCLSTLLGNADGTFISCLYSALKGVGFVTLCEFLLQIDRRIMLKAFCIAGALMCSFHLMTVFLYWDIPGGMRYGYIASGLGATTATIQNWYLLTYDNESIMYFLPVICAMVIYGLNYSKVSMYGAFVLTAVVGYTYIAKEAAAASVALITFLLLILLISVLCRGGLTPNCLYRTVCYIGLLGCAFVLIAIGSGIMTDIALALGRSSDFSGRSFIWEKAIKLFAQAPLFGQGIDQTVTTFLKIGQTHCHNIALEILYTGGLTAFSFLIIGIIASSPNRRPMSRRTDIVLASAIVSFFMAACMDWYPSIPIPFILFMLAQNTTISVDSCSAESTRQQLQPKHTRIGLYAHRLER
ncbi:O-antigen ligase family protein [Collinsella tanakaei]|nr:O-antigen ligase family protein [Collinsella tanakaei]